MTYEFPTRIKSYQIPAMQMFLQAQQGTSTWEEAAYACRLYDLPEAANYCDSMSGKTSVVEYPDAPPCPICGGVGSHVQGCEALVMQIKKNLPKTNPNFFQMLFGG